MSCGGFTNLCRTEIWRMPLSDGHAWSALAVCPSPTANLAPAEADGTDGVGATGGLIVTASYVDLRDETSGSTSLLGGGQGMRSETETSRHDGISNKSSREAEGTAISKKEDVGFLTS